MDEIQEIPIDDIDQEDSEEDTEEEIQRRSRIITSEIYTRLGIVILVLAVIALLFTILTYVFSDAWPDKTLLLIEQIIGYVLIGIATIIGTSLLIRARKLPSKEELILEPINMNNDTEDVSDEE